MNRYFVEGNKQEPYVELDGEKGVFVFRGRSIISNPIEFFSPIIQWLKEYSENPQEKTLVRMEMDYFNSSSFKALIDVFKVLKPLENAGLEVKWYAYRDDDIVDEANKIKEIANVEIEMLYLD